MSTDKQPSEMPLPAVRCLAKKQAAKYLGIGVTSLTALGVPCLMFGRRRVYDTVDLDAWLTEYKQRGRAGKETLWPVKQDSTGGETRASGGSMLYSPTADAYAKALGLKTAKTHKP